MSKIRQDIELVEGDIESPAEGDFAPYVIFTRLTEKGPHIYAGWVDAIDDAMALQFAREHYGQDQKCVNIWAIPRPAISGTEAEYPVSSDTGPVRPFEVFAQSRAGDQHIRVGSVEAAGSADALQAARQQFGDAGTHSLWVVPRERIVATGEGDVIWRHTSQDYRMARGYSASVREKWQKIRAEKDLTEYERDDLKEMF